MSFTKPRKEKREAPKPNRTQDTGPTNSQTKDRYRYAMDHSYGHSYDDVHSWDDTDGAGAGGWRGRKANTKRRRKQHVTAAVAPPPALDLTLRGTACRVTQDNALAENVCVSRSPVCLKRLSYAGVEFCPQPHQGSHLRVEAGPLPVPEKDLHLNRLPRRPKERADSVGSSLGMGLLLRAVAVTKKAQLVVCQNKKWNSRNRWKTNAQSD